LNIVIEHDKVLFTPEIGKVEIVDTKIMLKGFPSVKKGNGGDGR